MPRHAAIVARILRPAYTGPLTCLIGMAVWMLSGLYRRWCVVAQMVLVAVTNVPKASLGPDLLLWARANALFASLFIALLYY